MEPSGMRRLAQLRQSQNDAVREAEVLCAIQIKQQIGCTWSEALRVAKSVSVPAGRR